MCGIAGILHFDDRPVDRQVLQSMARVVRHRGPDAEGVYVDGNVGLGHRRLSIIDLSTGQQPMQSGDGTLVISFNGEIYNYRELRAELEQAGAEFVTDSDTEVILQAYAAWGIACQQRFNGMWAFAIWDRRERQLFVSRDRVGEKPLHYAVHGGAFVFASEIKSLLEYGIPARPRAELFEIYLTLGYIPAPHTFYQDIVRLRPGHYLLARDGRLTEHSYWTLPQPDEHGMRTSSREVYEEFAALLDDSVRLRMRCDVPFGAFLSGGLDSASVVSLMADHTEYPVETFTIGFDDPAFDERALARDVAAAFHTSHHEYVVNPDEFDESLNNTLRCYDEPFGDSSALPTSYVCRLAAQHVKMVLTGDGGDEVLSGYPAYQSEKLAARYRRIPATLQALLPGAINLFARPFSGRLRYRLNRIGGVCSTAGMGFLERLESKLAYVAPATIGRLLERPGDAWRARDFLAEVMRGCSYDDPFYRLMYFHFMVSLPDRMLTKVDRMSMAYSLETRVPFLDHRLIEFMAGVDKNVKMPGYDRKHVLKQTVAKGLPDSLTKAPKKGFVAPLREWFKAGEFDLRLARLEQGGSGLRTDVVRDIVTENRLGRRDNGNFIWMLLLLGQWLEGMG
ncbi:MAG: asparagine synthase (glutamine-hydrolyzing) [Pseudomonadota bacterium]